MVSSFKQIILSKKNKDKKIKMENEYLIESEPVGFFSLSMIGITVGILGYYISNDPMRLVKKIGNYLFYTPGVGSVSLKKKGKKRYGVVSTDLGDLNVPVMKLSSFENIHGYFRNKLDYPLGMMELDKFQDLYYGVVPDYEPAKTIGDYLIMNYRRPRDFEGRDELYGFILSEIDGLIYVYCVENNSLIDYEAIDEDYTQLIESYQPEEDDADSKEVEKKQQCCGDHMNSVGCVCFSTPYTADAGETELEESINFLKSMSESVPGEEYCKVNSTDWDENCTTGERIYGFDRDYRIDDPAVSFSTDTKKQEESLGDISEEDENKKDK